MDCGAKCPNKDPDHNGMTCCAACTDIFCHHGSIVFHGGVIVDDNDVLYSYANDISMSDIHRLHPEALTIFIHKEKNIDDYFTLEPAKEVLNDNIGEKLNDDTFPDIEKFKQYSIEEKKKNILIMLAIISASTKTLCLM